MPIGNHGGIRIKATKNSVIAIAPCGDKRAFTPNQAEEIAERLKRAARLARQFKGNVPLVEVD